MMTASSITPTPGLSASQTIGPFFRYGLAWDNGEYAFAKDAPGEHIELTGILTDGSGSPIVDAMIEFWQADAEGRFSGPGKGSCPGFARCYTNTEGRYTLHTVKPGAVAGPDGGPQAPHILVCLFSRGMLAQVYTRVYLEADAGDAVLKAAGPRAQTLVARAAGGAKYEWNIVLQGERETVFLDF
jgi:protocatechuate 3,4-dioxygenase alpha subunit